MTITDAHVVLGRIPPHLLGGEIPLDVDAARAGVEALAGKLGLSPEACATGVLEISAWNQANALRQVTVKRGLDVRDFTLTTFGGSGSLLLCRLMDILGIPTVLVPPNPGNVSAFGLLTVDVKNDYVQTHVSLAERLDAGVVSAAYDALTRQAADALAVEGFAPEQHVFQRTADLRYFGQAFEVRVPVPEGDLDDAALAAAADAFHAEHRVLYGYDFSGDASQQVEWVNLRVSGIGPITRPEIQRVADGLVTGASAPSSTSGEAAGLLRRGGRVRRHPGGPARRLAPGSSISGPVIVEEFGSTVPIHPGFEVRVDEYLNLIVTRQQGATREPARTHPVPVRAADRGRGGERRPRAGRDRPGLAGERGDGGGDRHRAHQPQPDDPRRPRLPRGHPRPAAAQADRPLVLRARPPRRPRLPDRGDARGRRLLPQRRLPLRGRDRAPARPLRHGAGVQRGGRWWRSCRPSATTTTSAARSPGRCPATRPACSRRA